MVNQEFIAEIGVNHEGDIKRAFHMIDALSSAGGKIAKFQIYKAEKLASNFATAYWDTTEEKITSQRRLFKKYDSFGIEEYSKLKDYCDKSQIEFMATFFDTDAISEMSFLVSRIKVASADITNFELLEAVTSCNKPLIISTGASSIEEISNAVRFCEEKGAKNITLMHCILNYPTLHENANLWRISVLKSNFPEVNIGYSDHTVPEDSHSIQLISWLLGANILEKHFTLDKKLPGNDHYHAFDQEDLKNYFTKLSLWEKFVNKDSNEQQLLDLQNSAREQARRGLFFKRNLKKGDLIQKQDLISLRPVIGISASEFFLVLGKRVSCDVKQGSPVYNETLE